MWLPQRLQPAAKRPPPWSLTPTVFLKRKILWNHFNFLFFKHYLKFYQTNFLLWTLHTTLFKKYDPHQINSQFYLFQNPKYFLKLHQTNPYFQHKHTGRVEDDSHVGNLLGLRNALIKPYLAQYMCVYGDNLFHLVHE